jgi:hypothetical protein
MKRLVGTSVVAGSTLALAVMAGYVARIALAVGRRERGWHEAREFLGISGRREH